MTTEPDTGDMGGFPSDEWVARLDSVLSKCRVGDTADLVLEYHVSDVDGSVYCWHVRICSGRVSAAPGRSSDAPGQALVALASDRETAREIAVAGKSAQRAFAEGRLRLSGDPRLLLAARPALEAVGAALSGPARPPT